MGPSPSRPGRTNGGELRMPGAREAEQGAEGAAAGEVTMTGRVRTRGYWTDSATPLAAWVSLLSRPTFALALCLLLSHLSAAMADDQAGASPEAPQKETAELEITELVKVMVSPFDVSTRLDRGYRASNSVSASP